MRCRRLLAHIALTALAAQAAAQEPPARTANDGTVILESVAEIPQTLADRVNRYLNIRSASFADWGADGDGMYILTRFADVTQIHRVDVPGGARHQITFFREPVSGASRRPGGSDLLFSMDEGGGEFFQLFLLDPRSGEERRLTDGRSRNLSPVWTRDGGRIAYQSTRRNGRSNDVWVMDVSDTSSARLVFAAPDGAGWTPADWSADGNQLLITHSISISDSRVHLLDLRTGVMKRIAGDPRRPANSTGIAPRFAPGDAGAYLATNAQNEFLHLAYLDLATGKLEVITRDIPWDVDEFALSDDGRRAAFVVNEAGFSRLYLLDPLARRYRQVESLPRGVIGDLKFSSDGRRLALTLGTPTTPADVYMLELGDDLTPAGALTRWTLSETGGLDPDEFIAPELITYPTFDRVNGKPRVIPALVYKPDGPGPHPVIVSIHGGPESQYRSGFSNTFQLWLRELGAAVISPNVRGSSGYGKEYVSLDNGVLRENSVRDIGALLDWIKTQPDLDADRVTVYGGSYGGYMVLASLVHYSDRLRAGVEIVGISNFVTFLESTREYRRDLRRVEYGDERDPKMRAFLDSISPNRRADRIRVPLFVAQGQNDPRVPFTESEQIVRVVRANGRDVWYMKALNEGHGFRKKPNRDLFDQIIVLFLRRHLLGRADVSE